MHVQDNVHIIPYDLDCTVKNILWEWQACLTQPPDQLNSLHISEFTSSYSTVKGL